MLVDLSQGRGKADREPQEISDFHRPAEEPIEGLAAGILEHQKRLTALALEFNGAYRPRAVQLMLEGQFVGKAIEGGPCWSFRGRELDQYADLRTFICVTPPSAESEFTVLR